MKKSKLALLLSMGSVVAACTSPLQNPGSVSKQGENTFKAKSLLSTSPSSSPLPKGIDMNQLPLPPKILQHKMNSFPAEKPELIFDNLDLSILNENNHENQITVVYDSAFSIKSNTEKNATNNPVVNEVLGQFKLLNSGDLTSGMTEFELVKDHQQLEKTFSGNIPNRSDIHTYTFSKSENIKTILHKLRALPFVKAANPVIKEDLSFTSTLIGRTSPTSSGARPSDDDFDPNNENSWWWFNRQHILEGQEAYNLSTMPTIAVIDSGFDTSASAIDRPNYLQGFAISGCTNVGTANCSSVLYGNDYVGDPPSYRGYSHGTSVAVLAGAPKNNGDHLSGVAPNAPILPIKIGLGNAFNTATAIREAAISNVDVINVSLSANDNRCPTPYVNDAVRMEVASAIGNGTMVFFAAGNAGVDIAASVNCGGGSNNTGGAIIVGGTTNDTSVTPNRMSAWSDPSDGSNYSTGIASSKIIHIAAAAKDIKVATYDPNNPGDRYTYVDSGTSWATPMVSATYGMVKKVLEDQGYTNMSPYQISNFLFAGANVARYTSGYSSTPETRFIGQNLISNYDAGNTRMIGMKTLNTYNSIKLAQNIDNYDGLVRVSNADDVVWATVNNDWNSSEKIEETFLNDSIWGIAGANQYDNVNFLTYSFSGSYAFNYHFMELRANGLLAGYSTSNGGVAGITGAEGNASQPQGWYAGSLDTFQE